MRRRLVAGLLVVFAAGVPLAQRADPEQARVRAGAAKLYDTSILHKIDIVIPPQDVDKIPRRTDERVHCTFTIDGVTLTNVGVRQAGGVYHGYVPVSGKPSLSIKFDEFTKGQVLFGLDKLVLKNELQDVSLASEHLTYDVFRRAGLPAPLTAHARVTINGIDSGIYLMREPIDKQFLVRNFGGGFEDGNLYEIMNVREFVFDPGYPPLDDEGKKGRTRRDLISFAAAIQRSTPASFVADVTPFLDLDRFVTFVAAEAATVHWDGLTYRNNNTYMYAHPKDGRFVFIPYGADQALGLSRQFSPFEQPRSYLVQKLLSVPALAQRVRDEVARIGREPVWNRQAFSQRLDGLARILATAERSGRTGSDAARLPTYRSAIESFLQRPVPLPGF